MEWSFFLVIALLVCLTLPFVTTFDRLSRHSFPTEHPPSPCLNKQDVTYGGVLVDCRGLRLTSFPPPVWIPADTTTLLLQDNSIMSLEANSSLQNATELRQLYLANNAIASIHQQAFRYNKKLRVLDLQSNRIRLDSQSIKQPLFYNLHNLTDLSLIYNKNDIVYNAAYPPHLLLGLFNLRTLSLDTFYGDLDFNGIFNKTTTLTTLVLGGGFTAIRNGTFRGFDSLKLKNLFLRDLPNFALTEINAYAPLVYLDSFHVVKVNQGTESVLESLAPFTNRNLTTLKIDKIHEASLDSYLLKRDCTLTIHLARYLSQICIKHFIFTKNDLFFAEPRTVTSPTWSRCLVSLDLSYNPLLGSTLELMHLSVMQSLKYLTFRDRKYSFLRKDPNDEYSKPNSAPVLKKEYQRCTSDETDTTKHAHSTKVLSRGRFTRKRTESNVNLVPVKSSLTIFLPRNLIYLNINGLSTNSISGDVKTRILGGDNLEEIYYSDSGGKKFTAAWRGLPNLKIFDISKNDGSIFSAAFLSSFPKMSKLIMSHMNLNKYFTSSIYEPIFHKLHNLEHLDLSHNNIYYLPSGIFSQNKRLQYLNLAGNRFNEMPLKLVLFDNLKLLDIGGNSIIRLSTPETTEIESYASKHPKFSIILDGNVFSCSCLSITFLKWLRVTKVDLNSDRNYSCTMEDGQLSGTNNISSIEGKWRDCQGQSALLASFSLLLLVVLGYPLVFLGIRLRTQIKAACYQYFSSHFAFKTPEDYSIGVYISYSDYDSDFACLTLREFVENQLYLSTYLRHRDLLPASDKAESTVDAINSSWRSLLVVTPEYLEDAWSYLAMKTATYTVSPSNPGRVVIVVLTSDEDNHLETQIPHYILQAVREDSVIRVTWDRRRHDNSLTILQQDDLRAALVG